MIQLFIFAAIYRFFQGLINLVTKHWVLILFFIILVAFFGISFGSFFIALYVLSKYKNGDTAFNKWAWIAFFLALFNFFALTADFYKEFPLIYKSTVVSNIAGLFMSVFYLTRFAEGISVSRTSLFFIICGLFLLPALFIYNKSYQVTQYLTTPDKNFAKLLQEEIRERYQAEFEEFRSSHHLLDASDYKNYTLANRKRYDDARNYGSDTTEICKCDQIILVSLSGMLYITYYTDPGRFGINIISTLGFINGLEADYHNGNVSFRKDITRELGYRRMEYARENHQPVYTEISFGATIILDDIDEYIKYKTRKSITESIIISESYLKKHNIPILPGKF